MAQLRRRVSSAFWATLFSITSCRARATEKVEAVAAWNARQKSVRQSSPVIILAA